MLRRLLAILAVLVLVASFSIVPVAIAQSDGDLTCSSSGRDLEGDAGTELTVTCPSDCTSGSLWGTDVYTDDSSVCQAAIHAGALDEAGGTVTVLIQEGLDEYPASEQNGISSSSWGAWSRSFAFAGASVMALSCSDTTIEGAEPGSIYNVSCPAACDAGSIWGTDVYTDDSYICTAAAHAGVISQSDGGEFTLAYVEGQDEYPASEQNGIESSSWGSWDLSFTFPDAGSAGASSSALALSCTDTTIEGAEAGSIYNVSCPAACDAGSIWGTDVYTDDSYICTAAAHAGVISQSDGGEFTLAYVEGQDEYPASEQNGIESSSWGSWDLGFTFALPLECGQTSVEGAEAGNVYMVACQAGCSAGSIWGTDIYTDDSDLCTAAAHAGAISLEDGGAFYIAYSGAQDEYPASEQNGIESSSWGSWDVSFTVAPLGGVGLECDTAANMLPGEAGTSLVVSCPAACDAGSIWGTDVYTDDSSVCTAAAHAGVITLEDGGAFILDIKEGQDEYPASEQNGIESSSWGAWERSFSVDG